MLEVTRIVDDYSRPRQVRFDPYDDNGGSIVAIAGSDFAIIGSDTRLSTGYTIHSREQSKLIPLTDTTILATSGCWADALQLKKKVFSALKGYQHNHNKVMSTTAIAQVISITLYYKRFFPYSLSNIIAGIDSEGKGCVYSYDPIGHCERSTYRAAGSSGALLQPLLDNQIGLKNMEGVTEPELTVDKALAILKDVFISAAERDIQTGDGVQISIITKDGVKSVDFELRKD